MSDTPSPSPCLSCGACCDYSRLWPRFTLETDSDIALIPAQFVDRSGSGMRCTGHRCAALEGVVGERVACRIYRVRPEVCRACQPGDDACTMARLRHGLAALPADEGPTCEPEE